MSSRHKACWRSSSPTSGSAVEYRTFSCARCWRGAGSLTAPTPALCRFDTAERSPHVMRDKRGNRVLSFNWKKRRAGMVCTPGEISECASRVGRPLSVHYAAVVSSLPALLEASPGAASRSVSVTSAPAESQYPPATEYRELPVRRRRHEGIGSFSRREICVESTQIAHLDEPVRINISLEAEERVAAKITRDANLLT